MGVESSAGAQIKERMHPANFHNDQVGCKSRT